MTNTTWQYEPFSSTLSFIAWSIIVHAAYNSFQLNVNGKLKRNLSILLFISDFTIFFMAEEIVRALRPNEWENWRRNFSLFLAISIQLECMVAVNHFFGFYFEQQQHHRCQNTCFHQAMPFSRHLQVKFIAFFDGIKHHKTRRGEMCFTMMMIIDKQVCRLWITKRCFVVKQNINLHKIICVSVRRNHVFRRVAAFYATTTVQMRCGGCGKKHREKSNNSKTKDAKLFGENHVKKDEPPNATHTWMNL